MTNDRDRDAAGRPRNARPRDGLGRPLPHGSPGVERRPNPAPGNPAESLREAHRLWSTGRPFEAHEVLEDAWKAAPPEARTLWRGLAQLAVGTTHAARGNRRGALSLLRRGADAIAPHAAANPLGLDVAAVLQWADDAVRRATADMPVVLDAPPLLPTPTQPPRG